MNVLARSGRDGLANVLARSERDGLVNVCVLVLSTHARGRGLVLGRITIVMMTV